MSGNLLGASFGKYVNNQIEVRQSLHGNKNKSIEELQYLNSSNAWIKLASGTSFDQDKIDSLGKGGNPLLTGVNPGSDLAIRNVLFDGLTSFGGLNQSKVDTAVANTNKVLALLGQSPKTQGEILATGISSGAGQSIYDFSQTQRAGIGGANGAYGVGGTQDYGYSPMPGIIDADVKDLNRGSIKKATINLVAHNRNQFEVIDALYLRLGFSVLLEWGMDKFPKSNTGGGYSIDNMRPSLIDKKFWGWANHSYNIVLPAIEEMRKKNEGNYDGMFGVISNFSWTFESDGSYKIKLEIMSQGDVVESLKANLPKNSDPNNPSSVYQSFAALQAAKKETQDSDQFFGLYPGLKEIITDWYNSAYNGASSFTPPDDFEDYPINFPSLNPLLYTNEDQTNQTQGQNLLSGRKFGEILSNSLEWVDTRRTNERNNDKWGADKFAAWGSDGLRYTGTSGEDTWRQSFGFKDGSFLQKIWNQEIEDGNGSQNYIGRLIWVYNIGFQTKSDGLENLLDKTWAKAKSLNFAGGPNDEQFKYETVTDDSTPEQTAEIEKKQELDAKKDKNRVFNWFWRIRNCWTLERVGTPGVDFNGSFGEIWDSFHLGDIINPVLTTGNTPRGKIWNDKVKWPIYPRPDDGYASPLGYASGADFIRMRWEAIGKQHYVRLGVFLEYLQTKVIPKIEEGANVGQPMLNIDYHHSNNICYTIDNVLSLNLNKILIKNQSFWIGTGTDTRQVFQTLKRFKEGDNRGDGLIWGNIMNIYVNFSRIEEFMDDVDTSDSVSIYSVLKNIATDINESLGNINNIEPIINKETNTVTFIDQTPIPGIKSIAAALGVPLFEGREDATLEIFGFNPTNGTSNFVQSVGITTEISKEYATMITIGATANGAIPGEESTAFSKWNKGIIDRFKTGIVDGEAVGGPTIEEQNKTIIDAYQEFCTLKLTRLGLEKNSWDYPREGKVGIQDRFILNEDLIGLNREVASNYYKYAQSQTLKLNSDSTESSMGFIPFNLKLKVDGISGIKIYNKINVNTSFLPKNYDDSLSFIITGVNHKLSNNSWVTNLDTIASLKSSKTPITINTPSLILSTSSTAAASTSSTTSTTSSSRTAVATGSTTVASNLAQIRSTNPEKVKGVIGTHGPSAEISPDAFTLEKINSLTKSSGATTELRKRAVKIALSYVGANEVKAREANGKLIQNLGWYDPIFQTKMENLPQSWKKSYAWCNCFTNLVWIEAFTTGNALVGEANNQTWANTFKEDFRSGKKNREDAKRKFFLGDKKNKALDLATGTGRTMNSFKRSFNGKYFIPLSEAKSGKNLPQPGDMVRYNKSHIEIVTKVYTKGGKMTHYDSVTGNSSAKDPRDGGGLFMRKKKKITTTIGGGITGFCVLSDTYS